MRTTTILDKILRNMEECREDIPQLFNYSLRKRDRFALADKEYRTERFSNANPTHSW